MTAPLRSWWRNCALEADSEIGDIDRMEDRIAPVDPNTAKIRELISGLELCHHKAERWVANIIAAIGAGKTRKGLGSRLAGQEHPAEKVWQNACAALSAWCAGCPAEKVEMDVGSEPARLLLHSLGERSSLKEWQVHRVIAKIRSAIHWPQSSEDPSARYEWILFSGGDYELAYRTECPDCYKEHEDFWMKTARTIIHDTANGDEAELSLGLAIDMLMPCHWQFVTNFRTVLGAIGGQLSPEKPFAACGRNIDLLPIRERMTIVSDTLRVYCGQPQRELQLDLEVLDRLGELTAAKKWLAASLDKTIRLQLDPPAAMRKLSALEGPAWIKRPE